MWLTATSYLFYRAFFKRVLCPGDAVDDQGIVVVFLSTLIPIPFVISICRPGFPVLPDHSFPFTRKKNPSEARTALPLTAGSDHTTDEQTTLLAPRIDQLQMWAALSLRIRNSINKLFTESDISVTRLNKYPLTPLMRRNKIAERNKNMCFLLRSLCCCLRFDLTANIRSL